MQKKARQLTVVPHPLLSQVELSLGDKMVYLQGCVLAALLDDENVSEEESQVVNRIGLSLGLSADEISECLSLVGGLKSEEDKEAFLDELKGGVSDFPIAKFFMADFEEVMKKKGKVPKSSVEFLDFVGGQIVGKEDWRKGLVVAGKKWAGAKKASNVEQQKQAVPESAKAKSSEKKSGDDIPEYGFGDRLWRFNEEHEGIECSFEGKPSESVRSKLKAAGFRFSGKQGLWYAKDSEKTRNAVKALGLTFVGASAPKKDKHKARGLTPFGAITSCAAVGIGIADALSSEIEDDDEPILASELISRIEGGDIGARVEDEEDCKPQVKSADVVSKYSDGECELTVHYGFPDEGTAGRLVFEVEGVCFSADRKFNGEHEPFEISGREIEYDDDLDEDAILEAVEDNVSITEFDPDDYDFDEKSVDASDVISVLDDQPSVFAVDDSDTVYGYDDEDDVDEDYEIIDTDEAIEKMLNEGTQVEFEQE